MTRYQPEHQPIGDPCAQCGYPPFVHRRRNRGNRYHEDHRDYETSIKYIGIDGEGQGRRNHRYIMLCAAREDNSQTWSVEAPDDGKSRLSTVQCLDLILELPKVRTRVFSYSFNYDLTKILTDVDNSGLYYLFRPNLRQRRRNPEKGPWSVRWCECHPGLPRGETCPLGLDYWLNMQGTKFTVTRRVGEKLVKTVIWDLFRFFGCKYVNALEDWKIGTEAERQAMSEMKDKRAILDKLPRGKIRDYCFSECSTMAELGHKLVRAHYAADLRLKSFYGAGSSGAAMLTAMEIRTKLVPTPTEMMEAVASAFFGGRFENSVIGTIRGRIFGFDISSAYPYQLYFLPCLEHGKWRLTRKSADVINARAALVRYKLPPNSEITHWAPFPFRTPTGSICYPQSSGGGWVWKDEFIAGKRLFPNCVKFVEAWVYDCECDCKPFSKIAEYYLLRLKLGKEGAGIVIKLGCNSCYGKIAQSVGNAPFNNWIWAGMITAGCRAQVLDMMRLHKDISNVLMVATDGLYTKEDIQTPIPLITGTDFEVNGKRKPLGGWERKEHDKGVFVARPGIYFPLEPSKDDIKEIRARGVGKGVVLENWKRIIESFEQKGVDEPVTIANIARFCGAKTCITSSREGYNRASHPYGSGKPSYGQWIDRKVEMSFNPMPKRERVSEDGQSLELRMMPQFMMSAPYKKALKQREDVTEEMLEALRAKLEITEQPDADLTEYEALEVDDF